MQGQEQSEDKKEEEEMKLKPEYIFPLALIALDLAAAMVYVVHKDYKKTVYWIAAAVLNITVTF